MSDTKKMLRAIINGQSAIKQELLKEISKNRKEIVKNGDDIGGVKKSLTERIDKLGLQLAELSDDAPTTEEFDELRGEFSKLKSQIASV